MISTVRLSGAEEKIKLEEVVVTATRVEESVEDTTSDVTVIKGEDIKQMNVEFVTDVLREIPELNLIQNGGAGKAATVHLRGGKSAHTLVMIDGIKVNSATTGSFDFSGIHVDEIERIEIIKGPQSTMYGSEAMAGVINIITKKGGGKPRIDFTFEAGSFGTYKPSVTISGDYKKLDYRITGTYFHTDGISAAKQGTERDMYENASVSGKFGFKISKIFELELTGKYYDDSTELDGFDFFARQAVDDPDYVQDGRHYLLSVKGMFYLTDIWEQILTVSTVEDRLKLRDPDTAFLNADIDAGIDTIDWQHNLYLSDFFILTAGAEYRIENGKNTGNFDESVDNKAVYLNNKLKLLEDDLVINAGLRYDDHETFGDKKTYRIGAVYHIRPVALKVMGSYGTGFRAPALNELFFPFFGNPDLRPEESRSWEIGLGKDFFKDRVNISVTYFNQKYKNLIKTDPLTFTAANISKAEVNGIELNTTIKVSDNINILAGYTYLDTEDKTTGKRLTLRPKDKLNLSAKFSIKNMTMIAQYTFVGKRFDSSVSRDLSSYSLVNVAFNYRLTKRIVVFARIDNLFDEDYEEAGSFGTPGFSIFGGIKLTSL
jgi:vitamin B12 transporter